MLIRRKTFFRKLKEAQENGIRMGIEVKQGGIYEGEPRIIREVKQILEGK
jgi:hypothetical protein